ncbi:MAG: hypothetical protein ABIV05_08685 [Actinomycetota bacterium]
MPFSLRSRWTVPAAGATAVVAALVISPMVADASPSLPPRTAAELLASTTAAADHPFSGTVVETARLGLPDLPTTGAGSTALSAASLVTGSHTARVWYAGPGRSRIALVGDLAESDVIRNGTDAWTWSSATNTAQHLTLPNATVEAPAPTSDITPAQAAAKALAAIDPTTTVSVEGTASIAGRSAYELVLAPKDAGSLVGQVRLAIDSVTSTPLRVEVFARGSGKPAFETTFTSVTFATPDPAVFSFSPPRGAKVTEQKMGAPTPGERPDAAKDTAAKDAQQPTVVGTGWTSVAVIKGVDLSAAGGNAQLSTLLRSAKQVSGSYGSGRVITTALVSALLLDDGRVLVGAVTPAVLEQAATRAG